MLQRIRNQENVCVGVKNEVLVLEQKQLSDQLLKK
jgi:hypothetical protein